MRRSSIRRRDDLTGRAVVDRQIGSGASRRKLGRRPVAGRIERGLVRITTVTRLEIGYSARSPADLRQGLRGSPLSRMPVEYATPAIEDRALEVMLLLADRGRHRAPSIPDLLIAATAELAGLIVLHVDKAFDLIADVTGQRVERLAAPEPHPA